MDNVLFLYLDKVAGKALDMDLFSLYLDNVVSKALEHEPVLMELLLCLLVLLLTLKHPTDKQPYNRYAGVKTNALKKNRNNMKIYECVTKIHIRT